MEHLGGQVVKFSPSSKQYANPMDLNMYCGDETPVALKSDFILSICDPTIGGKAGLQPMEKAILDRCVRIVCNEFFKNPKPENMPILQDVRGDEGPAGAGGQADGRCLRAVCFWAV